MAGPGGGPIGQERALKQGRLFYGWVIVGAGLLVWIMEPGMYASVGVFFKPVSQELGWSRTMVSGAIALTSIPLGVLAPISGALCDRYGPRRLVMASGLFAALGYALLARTQAPWQFYASYLLVGVGMGIAFAPITATVIRWFDQKRGLALGLTSVGSGIGGMLFPPVSNQLISAIGWRNSYWTMGSVMGALVILAGLFLRRHPEEMGLRPYGAMGGGVVAAVRPLPNPAYSLRQAVRTAPYWIVFFASLAAVLSHQAMMVHLVPYATDRGLTPATAAAVMAALGLGNSIGRLGVGALSDRMGRKRTLLAVLTASGLMMLAVSTARTPGMFFALAFLFGLAYGGAIICWMSLPGELFGLASLGALIGLIQTGSNLGGALGAFLPGFIFDATGSYTMAFVTAAAILFLASALALALRPPRHTEKPLAIQ